VLQGYLLAHYEFGPALSAGLERTNPYQKSGKDALVHAMYEIVSRAGDGKVAVVMSLNQPAVLATSVAHAEQLLAEARFDKDCGVVRFVMSVIMSRGPEKVQADMDDAEGCLAGRFGHCGQEMLNLLLTGKASSQMHDGIVKLAEGLALRGVMERPRVGFLTHLEALRLSKVGAYMKNPILPIWVIGSESHFSVMYSIDALCDVKTPAQMALETGHRAFGQFDSNENGFVDAAALKPLVESLNLGQDTSLMKVLEQKCEETVCLVFLPGFPSCVSGCSLRTQRRIDTFE